MSELSYWEEQAERLPRREVRSQVNGSRDDVCVVYRLIERMMDMFKWRPQPPACTEEPCPEEEHFVEVELPRAEQDFIKDVAAAFGWKITGLERIKNHGPPEAR
jgi:hypothetical protein